MTEAISAGLELESVLATPQYMDGAGGRLLARALPRPPLPVAPGLLAEITDADSPRGLVALVRLPRSGVDELPARRDGVYLYLEAVQDPGNLGALVRSAEGAGAAAVALSPGCAHPNHPRALRASAGSLLRMPLAIGVTPAALDERLAGLAPRWLALAPRGGSEPERELLSGTLVVGVGAEGAGLSPALTARADVRVSIPLDGRLESLNVAVAAALLLFEARRCRRAGGAS